MSNDRMSPEQEKVYSDLGIPVPGALTKEERRGYAAMGALPPEPEGLNGSVTFKMRPGPVGPTMHEGKMVMAASDPTVDPAVLKAALARITSDPEHAARIAPAIEQLIRAAFSMQSDPDCKEGAKGAITLSAPIPT